MEGTLNQSGQRHVGEVLGILMVLVDKLTNTRNSNSNLTLSSKL